MNTDETKRSDMYCYPNTTVFINKKGITDRDIFELYEGRSTALRIMELMERPISGDHSLQHWQSIHRHIFQDVYAWAGELRKVSIFHEYQSPYADPQKIEAGYQNLVQPVLQRTKHLNLSSGAALAKDVASLMGELYYLHPFRDGNTRSLLQFTKIIAQDAGIGLPVEKFSLAQWKDLQYGIVQIAHAQSPALLESLLEKCLVRVRPALEEAYTSPARALEAERDQRHLVESASTYTEALKVYTQAKTAQAERVETALTGQVQQQRARVEVAERERPGFISALWKGKAWQEQKQAGQTRLHVLEKRLSRVQSLKTDTRRLEVLAEDKLRRQHKKLTAERDAHLRQERERAAQEKQHLCEQNNEQSTSRGRGRGLGKE